MVMAQQSPTEYDGIRSRKYYRTPGFSSPGAASGPGTSSPIVPEEAEPSRLREVGFDIPGGPTGGATSGSGGLGQAPPGGIMGGMSGITSGDPVSIFGSVAGLQPGAMTAAARGIGGLLSGLGGQASGGSPNSVGTITLGTGPTMGVVGVNEPANQDNAPTAGLAGGSVDVQSHGASGAPGVTAEGHAQSSTGDPSGVDPGVDPGVGPGVAVGPSAWRRGGYIPGDGDGKLEPKPITAHEKEFVINPEMTAKYGTRVLSAINRGQIDPKALQALLRRPQTRLGKAGMGG